MDFSTKSQVAEINIWIKALLLCANFIVFARHFLASIWVLTGARQEALTGESYQWPLATTAVSLVSLVLSIIFLCALIGLLLNRWRFKKIVVISLIFFSAIEMFESIMLHLLYGPIKITDFSTYVYGPLTVGLAIINGRLLATQKSAASKNSVRS